ncbi:MAG: TPR end-of-group domain-containing protein [Chloroflexota bacterium]
MSEEPKWAIARIDEIEARDTWIPVREHLGIHAFGINAYRPRDNGEIINDHTEAGSGQEELYIVLDGRATFELDGEEIDAPAGTLVFARPESQRKASGDATVLVIGAAPGEAYAAIDWGASWPFHRESLTAYGEHRYADALAAVKQGLAANPDHAGLNYNYACFATLAGETGDRTFEHLRRAVELFPPFRAQAREDEDFASVRDDERFEEALR